MATLKDVANLAGVHPSTVSRVLRKIESLQIPEETRDRITKAATELNYLPDQNARSLRMGKSFSIGLIVPDISNPFFSRITRQIELLCFSKGYTVIVCNTDEDQEKEDKYLKQLVSRGVDGIIMAPVQKDNLHIKELLEKKRPLVFIDRIFDDVEAHSVISDNADAVYNAAKHFADLGHKRVALLRGRKDIYTVKKRVEGFIKAAKEFHFQDVDSLIVGNGFHLEDGYNAVKEVLKLQNPPTALISTGNLVAIGAIKAVLENGLSIPKDISIISFADSIFSPYLMTPLTTINHPRAEIGKHAFQLLLKQINSKIDIPYETIEVKTFFELRESTAKAS